VRLYAVCSKEEPIYIVTELLKDSLLNYLREGDGRNLKFPEMVDMAGQVRMIFLENYVYINTKLMSKISGHFVVYTCNIAQCVNVFWLIKGQFHMKVVLQQINSIYLKSTGYIWTHCDVIF
jgi:hypothetical protein